MYIDDKTVYEKIAQFIVAVVVYWTLPTVHCCKQDCVLNVFHFCFVSSKTDNIPTVGLNESVNVVIV